MADWRSMVLGNMGEDIAARRASNLSSALPAVLKELSDRQKERRGVTAKSQQTAEEATYAAFPEAAAKRAGIDIGAGGGADTTGMRKTKTVRGGTTYETPDVLDESGLSKIWMDYIAKVQSSNAANEKYLNYSPIPIPSFVKFTQQYFPEYVDIIRAGGGKGGKGTGDPRIQQIIDAELAKGTSAEKIKGFMKAKNLNPDDYTI